MQAESILQELTRKVVEKEEGLQQQEVDHIDHDSEDEYTLSKLCNFLYIYICPYSVILSSSYANLIILKFFITICFITNILSIIQFQFQKCIKYKFVHSIIYSYFILYFLYK